MPDWRTFYDSLYLSAHELLGRDFTVTIRAVKGEKLRNEANKTDRKAVLYFVGKTKGLALCKTNARTVVDLYGKNTDDWTGKRVTMYPTTTHFGKKLVDCIRLRNQIPGGAVKDAAPDPEPTPEERAAFDEAERAARADRGGDR